MLEMIILTSLCIALKMSIAGSVEVCLRYRNAMLNSRRTAKFSDGQSVDIPFILFSKSVAQVAK
jgi:hypothetical protein